VRDRALHELDQLRRRRVARRRRKLLDDRPRRPCPLGALAVIQEAPRAQPAVDLCAQLAQIPGSARGGQADGALDVHMPIGRRDEQRHELLAVEPAHEVVERRRRLALRPARRRWTSGSARSRTLQRSADPIGMPRAGSPQLRATTRCGW
jgi:hypothetical protein